MTSQYPTHRVHMSFQCRNGWHCQFLELALRTPLPNRLRFASPNKVVELVERGDGLSNLESRHEPDRVIEIGRDGVFLSLTEDQHSKVEGLSERGLLTPTRIDGRCLKGHSQPDMRVSLVFLGTLYFPSLLPPLGRGYTRAWLKTEQPKAC
jgi:hypothetical protein